MSPDIPDSSTPASAPDPATFIAKAERAVNVRDLDALVSVYAPTATLETITDGAADHYQGFHSIRDAWERDLRALAWRDFRLTKSLVAATESTIVNSWTGSLAGRTLSRGVEYWRFDRNGQVVEHTMHTYLNVLPSTALRQRIRLAFDYPITALAFLRARSSWRMPSRNI